METTLYFVDNATDEQSYGSPENCQDDAGLWAGKHEDGHVRRYE